MRRSIVAGLVALGSLAWLGTADAQNTWQDPRGRFAIDLPAGFKLSNEQLGRIYVFQGDDARVFVAAVSGKSDRAQLWRAALDEFTGPGVPPPPAESVTDLDVNGNPARVARYTFETEGGGNKVSFTVLLSAVLLETTGTGVTCFTLLNEKAAGRWGEPILQAFRSVRLPVPVVTST